MLHLMRLGDDKADIELNFPGTIFSPRQISLTNDITTRFERCQNSQARPSDGGFMATAGRQYRQNTINN